MSSFSPGPTASCTVLLPSLVNYPGYFSPSIRLRINTGALQTACWWADSMSVKRRSAGSTYTRGAGLEFWNFFSLKVTSRLIWGSLYMWEYTVSMKNMKNIIEQPIISHNRTGYARTNPIIKTTIKLIKSHIIVIFIHHKNMVAKTKKEKYNAQKQTETIKPKVI